MRPPHGASPPLTAAASSALGAPCLTRSSSSLRRQRAQPSRRRGSVGRPGGEALRSASVRRPLRGCVIAMARRLFAGAWLRKPHHAQVGRRWAARGGRWRQFPSRRPLTGGSLQRFPRPPFPPPLPAGARPRRAVGLRSAAGGRRRGRRSGEQVSGGSGARRAGHPCRRRGALPLGGSRRAAAGPRARGRAAPEDRGAPPCPRPERVGARAAPLLPAVPADGVRLRVIGLTLALTYTGGRGTVLRPKAPWLWCSRKFCCEMSARVWWYAEGSSPGFLLSVVLCFNSFAVQLCELRG